MTLDGKKLIGALSERLARETDRSLQNNIRSIRMAISINGKSIRELKKIVQEENGSRGRHLAIRAIGIKGGPDDVKFLR
jgi:hypothetical protein